MPRKTKLNNKLENADMLHGKTVSQKEKLEKIWGSKQNPYSTDSYDEYEKYIANLNRVDLYEHAAIVGVRPTNTKNRTLLEGKLLVEFKKYYNSLKPSEEPKQNLKTEQDRLTAKEKIRKIIMS